MPEEEKKESPPEKSEEEKRLEELCKDELRTRVATREDDLRHERSNR
jgi:hypothetical protein